MTAECLDEAEAAVLLSETSPKALDFRDRPEKAAHASPKLTTPDASKYLREAHGILRHISWRCSCFLSATVKSAAVAGMKRVKS